MTCVARYLLWEEDEPGFIKRFNPRIYRPVAYARCLGGYYVICEGDVGWELYGPDDDFFEPCGSRLSADSASTKEALRDLAQTHFAARVLAELVQTTKG